MIRPARFALFQPSTGTIQITLEANYVLCNQKDMTNDQKNTVINTLLRQARQKAGISLSDAASYLGITNASMSRMETGLAQVTANRVLELANYYGISPAALLEGNILTATTGAEMDRLHAIVLLVQQNIRDLAVNPSPEKVAGLVTEIYKRNIEQLITSGAPNEEFVAEKHTEFVQMVLRE